MKTIRLNAIQKELVRCFGDCQEKGRFIGKADLIRFCLELKRIGFVKITTENHCTLTIKGLSQYRKITMQEKKNYCIISK